MPKKPNQRSYKPSRNTKYTVKNNYGVYTKDGSYYSEEGRTKDLKKITPVKLLTIDNVKKPKAQLKKSASSAVSEKASNMKPTNVKSARKAAKSSVKAARATAKTANKKDKVAKKVAKIENRTARKVNRIARK